MKPFSEELMFCFGKVQSDPKPKTYLKPSRTGTMELFCGNSSNVNEVIRVVLNSLFYFSYKKILHAPKAPKAPKAQRHNQAKAQNATSEQK